MGPSAGRGLAYRQPDKVREVAGCGLPDHTNARRDSRGPQSQEEEAKDPWLSGSAVRGKVPGFHTDPEVPCGLVSRQSKVALQLSREEKNGETWPRSLCHARRTPRTAVC